MGRYTDEAITLTRTHAYQLGRIAVGRIVNGRLIELVNADIAYKLRDAAEQETDLRKAEPYLTRAERLSEGSDVEGGAMGTAIASAAA